MHDTKGTGRRICVVGAGVSGLAAAWALRDTHDVTLIEKNTRLGGHADTQTIDYDGVSIDVDTGFIVYNDHNYPNLIRLFEHLKVETISSDMSFAVSDPSAFEWSSNGFAGIFAWRRNLANPRFLGMLADIVRFSTAARNDLTNARVPLISLGDYVDQLGMGATFREQYLLPMGSAIWSTPEKEMLRYPALSFLQFFDNHRLLHAERPQWRTVKGGSKVYVAALRAALGSRVRAGDGVVSVRRDGPEVIVRTASGQESRFDQVVLACHSDEALAMLTDADAQERAHLDAIKYEPNVAWLHRDLKLMPQRRAAWASWNYMRAAGRSDRVCVSYWMNKLQQIDLSRPLIVTLNPAEHPDPKLTFGRFEYAHPQFNQAALDARNAILSTNGARRVWYAGAWLGNGFHEDGFISGLRVAERLGGSIPWGGAIERDMSSTGDKARAA